MRELRGRRCWLPLVLGLLAGLVLARAVSAFRRRMLAAAAQPGRMAELAEQLIRQGDELFLWGGGGIVADSEVDSEYQETLTKVRLLMQALS